MKRGWVYLPAETLRARFWGQEAGDRTHLRCCVEKGGSEVLVPDRHLLGLGRQLGGGRC